MFLVGIHLSDFNSWRLSVATILRYSLGLLLWKDMLNLGHMIGPCLVVITQWYNSQKHQTWVFAIRFRKRINKEIKITSAFVTPPNKDIYEQQLIHWIPSITFLFKTTITIYRYLLSHNWKDKSRHWNPVIHWN